LSIRHEAELVAFLEMASSPATAFPAGFSAVILTSSSAPARAERASSATAAIAGWNWPFLGGVLAGWGTGVVSVVEGDPTALAMEQYRRSRQENLASTPPPDQKTRSQATCGLKPGSKTSPNVLSRKLLCATATLFVIFSTF
jgi:hypothetical protein